MGILIYDKTARVCFTIESMTPEQEQALRAATPELRPETPILRAIADPDGEIWIVGGCSNVAYRTDSNRFSSAVLEGGAGAIVPSIKGNRACDQCGGPDGIFPERALDGIAYLCARCRGSVMARPIPRCRPKRRAPDNPDVGFVLPLE
jgi:hypothetical protein